MGCFQFLLSVSSIGTNELQHRVPLPQSPRRRAFSFLYRNERTATAPFDNFYQSQICFQFPLSERTNCNYNPANPAIIARSLSVSSIGTNELQPFRDLYIMLLPPFLSVSSIGTNELQHQAREQRAQAQIDLSVSSIGTNELQRLLRFSGH